MNLQPEKRDLKGLATFTSRQVGVRPIEFKALPGPEARALQTLSAGDNIAFTFPGGILMNHKKIKKYQSHKIYCGRLKARRKKVVFTNGCFDILHVGHVHYLRKAKKLGDILLVGLNTDRSVRQIKGKKRPIVPQEDRAEVLAALEFVDYVVLFDEPDPFSLIEKVKPTILVKGADWPRAKLSAGGGGKAGGRVVRIPLVPGASSTGVIERIIQVYCGKKTRDRPSGLRSVRRRRTRGALRFAALEARATPSRTGNFVALRPSDLLFLPQAPPAAGRSSSEAVFR